MVPLLLPTLYFYPRPPRGGRQNPATLSDKLEVFLSTPSARRATLLCVNARYYKSISIHALREEGDIVPPL